MAKTIKFKSTPENWRKEYLGLKPNTIREVEEGDIRREVLNEFIEERWNLIVIAIENTKTMEVFWRMVTDVTLWKGEYIISWEHPELLGGKNEK